MKPLIVIRDQREHGRRRKPWNRAFNSASIKDYEPLLRKRVKLFVDRLREQKGALDLARWISFFT